MKKILFILCLFPAIVGAATFDPLSIIQGARISHNQTYLCPGSGLTTGDDIGQFYVNCTDSVFASGSETYTYSITAGNTSSAFKISATGLIEVDNAAAIMYTGTDYDLTILVSDVSGTTRSETDHAYIIVTDPSYDHYIDLDAGTNGVGTRLSPWNNLAGVTYSAGNAYYIKRGTTSPDGDYISIQNASSPAAYINIGAYGNGARPIIDGTGSEQGQAFVTGINSDTPTEAQKTQKVRFMDVEIRDYTSGDQNGIKISGGDSYILLARLKVTGTGTGQNTNACFYFRKYQTNLFTFDAHINVEDCEANSARATAKGFKCEGGGLTFTNIWGTNNNRWLWNAVWGSKNVVHYLWGRDNGVTGDGEVQFRKSNTELRWAVLRNASASYNISIYDDVETAGGVNDPDSCLISDVYIVSGYAEGIYFDTGIAQTGGVSNTIRRLIYKRTGSGSATTGGVVIATGNDKTTIEDCIFQGNATSGIYINSASVTNLNIYYNLFYDNTYNGVNINNVGANCKVWNNTAYNNTLDDFKNNVAVNVSFINNSYQDRNSVAYWSPSTTNYVYSSDPYTDKANKFFTPVSTGSLINAGTDLGFTTDMSGGTVPRGLLPEIGCFEFVPSSTYRTVSLFLKN